MLVWSCIAPHGGEVIPELAGHNLARMAVTRAGMQALGERCRRAQPDTIVVFTPHGEQVEGCITVGAAQQAEGLLDGEDGASVRAVFDVDLPLTESLMEAVFAAGVPMLPVAFVDEEHNVLPFSLDWGAFVPLWFMGAGLERPPKVVVLCPSRSLPRACLVEAGAAIAKVCAESEDRIALICSADQGHGHDDNGPYGFSAVSAEYDREYVAAVREDALQSLLSWDHEWIDAAMTDSYWQTLMLHGALLHTPMRPELLSYEAPTYFGMACAAFEVV